MSRERPIIAITKPDGKDFLPYLCVAAAVFAAGGKPLAVTAKTNRDDLAFDGIVVGGGQDIFPMLYDDTPKHGYAYDQPRDEMDIQLVKKAVAEDIPILGICRGAQLMNVARGGSLHLNVRDVFDNADYPDGLLDRIFFRKKIVTEPGSITRQALGQRVDRVNSLHKQAVKRLGTGLVATAIEDNGIVQAIEDRRKTFFLGVQFHPEFLIHRARFRQVFGTLVACAAGQPECSKRQEAGGRAEMVT